MSGVRTISLGRDLLTNRILVRGGPYPLPVRSSKYNAALLGPIVQSSSTLAEVLRRLGLPATGGNYRHISGRIRQTNLDISHFGTRTLAARCAAVTTERLAQLVQESTSIAQVLTRLELPTNGRSHREITRRIRNLAIDKAHLRGHGWSRGETKASHPAVARISQRQRFQDAKVFVENASLTGGKSLTPRLLAMGWSYRCAWCEIAEWRGKALVLHLDHINGINNDNRLLNLRFLCPNCHSQTDTYGRRRR